MSTTTDDLMDTDHNTTIYQCPRCRAAGHYEGDQRLGIYLIVALHCDNGHDWAVRFLVHSDRDRG
jgi:hypothetical protein